MGRPKRTYEVRRVRLDGYLPVGVDPDVDALLAWLDGLPNRKKFPIVIQRLISGGVELGDSKVSVDIAEAEAAAERLMEQFGG